MDEDDSTFNARLDDDYQKVIDCAQGLRDILGQNPNTSPDNGMTKHTREEKNRRDLHRRLLDLVNKHTKPMLDLVERGEFECFGLDADQIAEAANVTIKRR